MLAKANGAVYRALILPATAWPSRSCLEIGNNPILRRSTRGQRRGAFPSECRYGLCWTGEQGYLFMDYVERTLDASSKRAGVSPG